MYKYIVHGKVGKSVQGDAKTDPKIEIEISQ